MGSSLKTIEENEEIDSQQTQSKIFMNKVKGLKKKMFELTTLCGSTCKKMKSWPETKLEVLYILRKFKAKKVEKKKEENDRKTVKGNYDVGRVSSREEGLSKDSTLKLLSGMGEELEKIKEIIEALGLRVEREIKRCTVKEEEEEKSTDSDESESGYCTPLGID